MEKGTKGLPVGSTLAYAARFCRSRRAAAPPAVVAAAGRVLMDKGWMMEMSAMVMPPGQLIVNVFEDVVRGFEGI
jgi:hypothetical protein